MWALEVYYDIHLHHNKEHQLTVAGNLLFVKLCLSLSHFLFLDLWDQLPVGFSFKGYKRATMLNRKRKKLLLGEFSKI
jgi:hypothetical protein